MATLPTSSTQAEEAVESYLKTIAETGPTFELVRGRIIPVAPPSPNRDRVLQALRGALQDFCDAERPGAIACTTPHLIRTGLSSLRLPDLSLIDEPIAATVGTVPLLGTMPALTVEIVAPGRGRDDYRAKRSEYAAAGISEYWIVDLDLRKVSVMLWSDGFYDCTEYSGHTHIASPRFPLRSVQVDTLLAR